MKLEVIEHIQYFSGYLDAVTRLYTNEKVLFSSVVINIPDNSSLEKMIDAKIIKEESIKNMVSFEKDVSLIFKESSKERILFYLTEYFLWFREFTFSCECKKYYLEGKKIPEDHIAYKLFINEEFHILVYICAIKKSLTSRLN